MTGGWFMALFYSQKIVNISVLMGMCMINLKTKLIKHDKNRLGAFPILGLCFTHCSKIAIVGTTRNHIYIYHVTDHGTSHGLLMTSCDFVIEPVFGVSATVLIRNLLKRAELFFFVSFFWVGYTYIHIYIYTYIHVHIYIYIYIYISYIYTVLLFVQIYIQYVFVDIVYWSVYSFLHVSIYVNMHLFNWIPSKKWPLSVEYMLNLPISSAGEKKENIREHPNFVDISWHLDLCQQNLRPVWLGCQLGPVRHGTTSEQDAMRLPSSDIAQLSTVLLWPR
jgi:hypothetical protein